MAGVWDQDLTLGFVLVMSHLVPSYWKYNPCMSSTGLAWEHARIRDSGPILDPVNHDLRLNKNPRWITYFPGEAHDNLRNTNPHLPASLKTNNFSELLSPTNTSTSFPFLSNSEVFSDWVVNFYKRMRINFFQAKTICGLYSTCQDFI